MKIFLRSLMTVMIMGGKALAEEGVISDGMIGAAYGLRNDYCNSLESASAGPQASDNARDRESAPYDQHN